MERHCDAIFAYSTQAETYFKTIGVKPQRIFKAINVISVDKKLREIQENGSVEKEPGFNLVFVGAITPQKQLEILVDAVNDLSKEHEDVSLHIIGDGIYLDTIKGYVAQDNITANVVFHGRVTNGLNVLLQKYSVLVLPGLGGLAIVDGMISSLPVISGRADGTELDLISNGENGYVTDVMSKDYLLEKMEYLYNNPEEVKKMGQASFERITGQFSFRNYMKVFESCLRSLGYAE
jgi:glycosyltransferase involved in cell wall biosynthesis